ncbi:MAG: hypothetical protein WA751_06585 [Candidatus Dormiibacterota bacterium]
MVLPAAGMVSVVAVGLILVVLIALVATRSQRVLGQLDLLILLLGCLLLFTEAKVQITFHPGYGTDEGAFLMGAASLLIHGHDPYGPSLQAAFQTYHVTAPLTYTMTGGNLSHFGYPGLAVLLVAGFLWLIHGAQAAVWADVTALTVAMVLAFFMLPRQIRALSVLLAAGLPFLVGYATSGETAILMTPFLLVTAWRWTAIGRSGTLSRLDWVKAICLGLALSIEQISWFVAPFLVVAIWLVLAHQDTRRQATITVSRFVLVALATFALVNAPFIVLGAGAWLSGILEPLTAPTIVNGQGIIDGAIFFHIGGGDVAAFSVAAALAYVALLVALVVWFARLGRAVFILPVLPFFLSAESLSGYWTLPLLVWAVSLFTVDPTPFADSSAASVTRPIRWVTGTLFGALVIGAAGFLGLAGVSPAPLQITVGRVQASGNPRVVDSIDLVVENRSGHALHPHFTASVSGEGTAFWRTARATAVVPAYSTRTLVITPPTESAVAASAAFVIIAVTAAPETVSSSDRVSVPAPDPPPG